MGKSGQRSPLQAPAWKRKPAPGAAGRARWGSAAACFVSEWALMPKGSNHGQGTVPLSSDSQNGTSVFGYATGLLARRAVGNAMDGTSTAGRHEHCEPISGANCFHPFPHAARTDRHARHVAALLFTLATDHHGPN